MQALGPDLRPFGYLDFLPFLARLDAALSSDRLLLLFARGLMFPSIHSTAAETHSLLRAFWSYREKSFRVVVGSTPELSGAVGLVLRFFEFFPIGLEKQDKRFEDFKIYPIGKTVPYGLP